jgi:hypothetical protein
MDRVMIQGGQIVFLDNLMLPNPGPGKDAAIDPPLFLVWTDKVEGLRIIGAQAEHRIEDEKSIRTGAVERLLAMFQAESGRWYIPLSTLIPYTEVTSNPSYQHVVTLDLSLSDGSRHLVEVRLRAVRARVTVEVIHRNSSQGLAASFYGKGDASLVRAIPEQGWPVATTELKNPNDYPLKVWLRAPNPGVFSFETALTRSRTETNRRGSYTSSTTEKVFASFRLSRVQITGLPPHLPETVNLDTSKWSSVMIAPNEKIQIAWLALPVPDANRCAAPSEVKTNVLKTIPLACVGVFSNYCHPDQLFNHDITDSWSYAGAQIKGEWQGEMRVSNAWEAMGEVMDKNSPLIVVSEFGSSVQDQIGSHASGGALYSACQGYF